MGYYTNQNKEKSEDHEKVRKNQKGNFLRMLLQRKNGYYSDSKNLRTTFVITFTPASSDLGPRSKREE